MAVVIPNTVRVVFTYTRATDDEVVQTFHCARGNDETMESLNQFCSNLMDAMAGGSHPWRNILSGAVTLARITAYDLHPGSAIAGEAEAPTGLTGVGNPTAHQVAAVISWLTDRRGAQYRGRTYVGPLAAGMLDTGGLLTAGVRTQLLDGAEWLHTTFGLQGRPLGVASTTYQTRWDITAARVDNSPDVQRRRQRRATAFSVRSLPLD